ncbi:MAG: hypothetical protein HRU09_06130 [Oligoflexales bacterium]|nr:hypothetical protein [Oligoflexales bacterium]
MNRSGLLRTPTPKAFALAKMSVSEVSSKACIAKAKDPSMVTQAELNSLLNWGKLHENGGSRG